MKVLLPPQQKEVAALINSQLWASVKLCLKDRMCEAADVKDEPHVAAAKGHKRAAFEECIEAIEALPFDVQESEMNPFERPAVSITED